LQQLTPSCTIAAMVDWDDFKYFSAVAQSGSVRGAARLLGVNASTVTRRLEQFERRLGIRLFARTRQGLVITADGEEVVQALEGVAVRLEEIERRLRDRDADVAGVVRINVPEVVQAELFMPALSHIARQHPQVVIELSRAWEPPDLDKRESDLSVVLTDMPPGHLIGRRLGRLSLAGYTHMDAARDSAIPWLSSALERALAPDYAERVCPERVVGGYLHAMDLQLAAAVAGMGATLLPCYVGDGQAQLRRMPMTGAEDDLRCEIWLLSHPDSRGIARTQLMAGAIADALRNHRSALEQEMES